VPSEQRRGPLHQVPRLVRHHLLPILLICLYRRRLRKILWYQVQQGVHEHRGLDQFHPLHRSRRERPLRRILVEVEGRSELSERLGGAG
jgi:hypothetical protein